MPTKSTRYDGGFTQAFASSSWLRIFAFLAVLVSITWTFGVAPHLHPVAERVPDDSELPWVSGEFRPHNTRALYAFVSDSGARLNLQCLPDEERWHTCLEAAGRRFTRAPVSIKYFAFPGPFGPIDTLMAVRINGSSILSYPAQRAAVLSDIQRYNEARPFMLALGLGALSVELLFFAIGSVRKIYVAVRR